MLSRILVLFLRLISFPPKLSPTELSCVLAVLLFIIFWLCPKHIWVRATLVRKAKLNETRCHNQCLRQKGSDKLDTSQVVI